MTAYDATHAATYRNQVATTSYYGNRQCRIVAAATLYYGDHQFRKLAATSVMAHVITHELLDAKHMST